MKKANIEDYFICLFVQLRLGKERCLRVNRILASQQRLLNLDEVFTPADQTFPQFDVFISVRCVFIIHRIGVAKWIHTKLVRLQFQGSANVNALDHTGIIDHIDVHPLRGQHWPWHILRLHELIRTFPFMEQSQRQGICVLRIRNESHEWPSFTASLFRQLSSVGTMTESQVINYYFVHALVHHFSI